MREPVEVLVDGAWVRGTLVVIEHARESGPKDWLGVVEYGDEVAWFPSRMIRHATASAFAPHAPVDFGRRGLPCVPDLSDDARRMGAPGAS